MSLWGADFHIVFKLRFLFLLFDDLHRFFVRCILTCRKETILINFLKHFKWTGLMHDVAADESCLLHLQVSSSEKPSWRCDWSFAWRCHAPDTIDYDQHMLSPMICMFQCTLRNESNLELLLHNVLENLQSWMPGVENCQWMDWSVGSVPNTMWTDHVIGKTNITIILGNCN